MTTNIPTNTPLQQQIDEFIAEGASWLPTGLLWDLLRPIGQLITSGAAERSIKAGTQAPDFTLLDARGTAGKLSHLLEQAPLVMTYYPPQGCAYCLMLLRAHHHC